MLKVMITSVSQMANLVYPEFCAFPSSKSKMRQFCKNKNVEDKLAVIQGNSQRYQLEIKPSSTGDGVFNGENAIPHAGIPVACLIAHIKLKHKTPDGTYTFTGKIGARSYDFDGKPCLETHKKPWNVSFINHSCCNANCAWIWEIDKTGIPLLVVYTTGRIEPGEQLCVDYGEEFFKAIPTLIEEGVAKESIQSCMCNGGNPCPSNKGYIKPQETPTVANKPDPETSVPRKRKRGRTFLGMKKRC